MPCSTYRYRNFLVLLSAACSLVPLSYTWSWRVLWFMGLQRSMIKSRGEVDWGLQGGGSEGAR